MALFACKVGGSEGANLTPVYTGSPTNNEQVDISSIISDYATKTISDFLIGVNSVSASATGSQESNTINPRITNYDATTGILTVTGCRYAYLALRINVNITIYCIG